MSNMKMIISLCTIEPNENIPCDVVTIQHAVNSSAEIKIEFTKEKMRFYIFMRCKLGESAKLIHETLQIVFGDCACSYQNVCCWVKEFNEGKDSLSDCPRPGPLKSSVNEQTIASIKKDVDEDPHISERELSDTNGLSYGTVHTIITEHLRMKKNMTQLRDLEKTFVLNFQCIGDIVRAMFYGVERWQVPKLP
ncbi:transposase [Elysia marginata]|uniref:Transposase n=1 Tax=Elysia marginata TaxID=1093978 RepID=A0AAV4G7R8_9GAST|nr:transposase [Elysia marginata]